jgi:shikimate dehydrogenase
LIKNKIKNKINSITKPYAGIIGINVSEGARSPLLWNAVYRELGDDIQMYPLDIEANRLESLLETLQSDTDFLGGSVAFPHKQAVAGWLGKNITSAALYIGAVNCIYRDTSGHLMGTNTDGEAAVQSYERNFGAVRGKKVLVIGFGGVARAVLAFFGINHAARLDLLIHQNRPCSQETKYFNINSIIEWNELVNIEPYDVVINCSLLGNHLHLNETPIPFEILKTARKYCVVFDVIYDPEETLFIKSAKSLGLKTLNGKEMNLLQAVRGFEHVNKYLVKKNTPQFVLKTMRSVP